jgi:hypothetical protein
MHEMLCHIACAFHFSEVTEARTSAAVVADMLSVPRCCNAPQMGRGAVDCSIEMHRGDGAIRCVRSGSHLLARFSGFAMCLLVRGVNMHMLVICLGGLNSLTEEYLPGDIRQNLAYQAVASSSPCMGFPDLVVKMGYPRVQEARLTNLASEPAPAPHHHSHPGTLHLAHFFHQSPGCPPPRG